MKTILVALDGSPRAEGVLAYAISLARLASAKLVLFRSVSVPPDMLLDWPESDEPLEAALRREAIVYLEECARAVPSGLLADIQTACAPPWRGVCAAARDQNVDLVVIGSHGYSGIDHLVGTTAAKIVNHADRPVLVVRPFPTP